MVLDISKYDFHDALRRASSIAISEFQFLGGSSNGRSGTRASLPPKEVVDLHTILTRISRSTLELSPSFPPFLSFSLLGVKPNQNSCPHSKSCLHPLYLFLQSLHLRQWRYATLSPPLFSKLPYSLTIYYSASFTFAFPYTVTCATRKEDFRQTTEGNYIQFYYCRRDGSLS